MRSAPLGIPLGVCLGFALGGSLRFTADHSGKTLSDALWSQEAAGWAQAVGTFLAIVAASVVAGWQMRRSNDLERDRVQREEFAARALLAAGLDEIASNTIDNIKKIVAGSSMVAAGKPASIALQYTSPGFAQICEARLRVFALEAHEGESTGFQLQARLRDCAELYERASAYFEYARASRTPAPRASELMRALRIAGLDETDFPTLWNDLERKHLKETEVAVKDCS